MIKIENVVLPSAEQWEAIIRGARNAMNSWNKSDSDFDYLAFDDTPYIGDNDLDLLTRLSKAGTDHSKYLRMIPVILDITAPMYWY